MTDTQKKTINFIKEKRTKLGMSQKKLTEIIGINSNGYMCLVESGRKKITLETLDKILTALNSKIKFEEL